MKVSIPYLADMPEVAGTKTVRALLLIGVALWLGGCSDQKIRSETQQTSKVVLVSPTTQAQASGMLSENFRKEGVAFITPSSITGQEEDKQAVALAFTGVLTTARPDMRVVSLQDTLSAVNRSGLTSEYREMFRNYTLTGIFDRETLAKVAKVTGVRYLAQLKLGAFRQDSKNRWGMLGFRVMDTKTSSIRLFLQVWDSEDGTIAWEGSQESSLSYDSFAEENVYLQNVVEESGRDLVAHLP